MGEYPEGLVEPVRAINRAIERLQRIEVSLESYSKTAIVTPQFLDLKKKLDT
jgi:hypothetical protein